MLTVTGERGRLGWLVQEGQGRAPVHRGGRAGGELHRVERGWVLSIVVWPAAATCACMFWALQRRRGRGTLPGGLGDIAPTAARPEASRC